MGLYWRTLEMSRTLAFSCYRCGPRVPMTEQLVAPMELRLACEQCHVVLLIVVTQAIPKAPDELRGVIRYRAGRAIDHGAGFRCHNCGKRLAHHKEGGPHNCPRCHAWHYIGSVSHPPTRPRVLRSGSTASASPPATRAFSVP
jgi:Zn finger protein HypA/HybF involved in hydrogenase expression